VLLRIAAVLLLVLANAFFVAAEFSLVRARRPRLEGMAREGDRLARLALRTTRDPAHVLAASELGITLSALGLGWVLAGWAITITWPAGTPAAIAALVIAVITTVSLHILFGELTPRALALAQPERVARLLAPPLFAFSWVVRPLTAGLAGAARRINRSIRTHTPATEIGTAHGPDELRLLVEEGEELGAIEPEDAELLEGVLEFSEKSARDVMTPRTEIVAVPADATLDETLRIVEDAGLSRYPVYDGSIDNIVGLLLAKDLIPLAHRPPWPFSLRRVMRPVHFIPATREIEDVLADFKRLKEHMAIVLDEYGGTAGVVTMEDLLEEIVGEILDEYDEAIPPPPSPAGGEIIVPGDMTIGELNDRHGLAVPNRDHTTIGGFVFGALGRLPHPGDSVAAGGATFIVRELDGRRIASLAVRPAQG
jgi:CBS domain containing-hemolysin-like protein